MPLSIGVDVGGTKVAAVLTDQEGRVLFDSWARHEITSFGDLSAHLLHIMAAYREVALARDDEIIGVGLSVAAWLSPSRSEVSLAANLGIAGIEMSAELSHRLGVMTVLENDGNCAAWGEYRRGAGRGWSSLTLISLGTGVGGGIVVDGRLLLGGHGLGGEIGHLPTGMAGEVCSCGGRGCLEQFASGRALGSIASQLRAANMLPSVESEPTTTSATLVLAARRGDRAAIDALAEVGITIGRAIRSIIPLIDPEVIVLAGTVAIAAQEFVLPAVQSELRAAPSLPRARQTQLVTMTELGPNAAAIGAAELVWDRAATLAHQEEGKPS